MGNFTRPYLESQQGEPQPASEHFLTLGPQTSWNEYEEPAATDLLALTTRTSPNAPRARLDNAELRGTRAPGPSIPGVYPEVAFDAEFHLQPPGELTVTAILDDTDNPPQGDRAFRNFFGKVKIVNTHAEVAVGSVVSHTPDKTIITVPNSALFAVNDRCALRTAAANAAKSGPANNEVRRIATLNEGGADRLSFEPGFSRPPIATTDKIQGVRLYTPTRRWADLLSARALEGAVGKQLYNGKTNTVGITLSPEEAIKVTAGLMMTQMIVSGIDQIRSVGGTDALADTDLTVQVGDASKYEVGSFVDLVVVDVATDTLTTTERNLEITARDLTVSPHTITFGARGTADPSLASATDLTARTSGTEEKAGTYDFTTKRYLKFRVDKKPFKTVDLVSLGATASEAATVSFLNAFLAADADYGYNVGQGHNSINWGTGVFVDGTGVEMHSKLWGSQSMVEVAVADQGAAASAHDELFDDAFQIYATEEVQIVPHDPQGTQTGVEKVGFSVKCRWGSYNLGCNSVSVSGSNNARALRELDGNPRPFSVIAGKSRTWDVKLDLYQRQDAALFFEWEREGALKPFALQTDFDGQVAGEGFGMEWPTGKITAVELGGDDEVATLTLTLSVEGTDDDEGAECSAYIF